MTRGRRCLFLLTLLVPACSGGGGPSIRIPEDRSGGRDAGQDGERSDGSPGMEDREDPGGDASVLDAGADHGVADRGTTPECLALSDCGESEHCVDGHCVCFPGYHREPGAGCVPDDPCADVVCPLHAHCVAGPPAGCACDEGFVDDAAGGCKPEVACTPDSCDVKRYCDPASGLCLCKPGFDAVGDQCLPPAHGDPGKRTEQEVCQRYHQEILSTAAQQSIGGADAPQCVPGQVTREALNDGLRRLNLYRWLAGVDPAWDVPQVAAQEQACALMQDAAGYLNHFPEPSAPCYTPEGAAAAGSSNLALGCWDLPCTIDLYIGDVNVPSLGHRRWCLSPGLGETGFGIFHAGSCMYSFGGGNSDAPAFLAYPGPGWYPAALISGIWSFSPIAYQVTAGTWADAVLLDSGQVRPLAMEDAGSSYGFLTTYALIPQGGGLAGPVQVRIHGLLSQGQTIDLEYAVRPTECP